MFYNSTNNRNSHQASCSLLRQPVKKNKIKTRIEFTPPPPTTSNCVLRLKATIKGEMVKLG